MPPPAPSPVVQAFLESFTTQYEELRNLRASDGPKLIAPTCRATDDLEVARAYRLTDLAATKWTPWAIEPYRDAGHDRVRSYLHQLPRIANHDTAHDAEGLLAAAFNWASRYPRIVINAARDAATHAAEIETDLLGADNSDALLGAARAAGACLAAAGIATAELAAAISEAQATGEMLA